MGRREIPLKGGEEYDLLTSWRQFLNSRHRAHKAKRSFARRHRRHDRSLCREES